jgi:broad specificity phosphatase PhoE
VVSYFLTHPEVVVDPSVDVESWRLSSVGRSRAAAAAPLAWGAGVARIVASAERKAVETADILARAVGAVATSDVLLGEIDRSATGFLPPTEFEAVVDAFFARPTESARGWERAVDAQQRIIDAVRAQTADGADVTIVSHGAVGALLLADLTQQPIARQLDQPGLGSYFAFDARTWRLVRGWTRVAPDVADAEH